ncbi:MAG: NUDIX hydrolase [Xanthobacteraceae bacterium]|nr:NUDIX hydrolase [Xanthobacteraceae bacterium]
MAGLIESVRTVYEGWTRFLVATVRGLDGGRLDRVILDHGLSACVLPYDAGRRTAMLVSQVRVPVAYAGDAGEVLEAIAGRVEEEDAAATVRREAMEEAGLRLDALEHVATVWASPGISTERITLYLAPYAQEDRVAAGGGAADEHESITVHELPLAELRDRAAAGRLVDMKTLALVQALALRHPELFA